MNMSQLIDQGVQRMRQPHWQLGYAEPRETGPWADVYDVGAGIGGGQPLAVLIGQCDEHDNWEPMPTDAAPSD